MEMYMPEVGSYAGAIDFLVLLVTVLVGFWFLLAEGVFFGLILKFKAKPGVRSLYIAGDQKQQTKWITRAHNIILLCDVVLIFFAVRVWYDVKQDLKVGDETVRVIAQQWAWVFENAGLDGQIGTADDIRTVNEMHIQVGRTYVYEMVSRDVLHSLSIPVFRLKHDVIPGRNVKGWFKAEQGGAWDIQCAEICGIGHALMPARMFVETPEEHAAWIRANSPSPTAVAALP